MIYLFCMVTSGVLAVVAEKKNSRIALFFVTLILSFFCGSRSIEVGVDTANYYNYFLSIAHIGIGFGSDIGFSVISYFLMKYFDNPHIAFLFFAFVTNYLILFRLWDFREKAFFPLMVVIYMAVYYPYSFNIVRQFLAIAVVFWATKYIERNKYFRYAILNILAASFHTSALLCFCYLFVEQGFQAKKKQQRYLGFGLACIFVAAGFLVFSSNIQKYEQYFTQTTAVLHPMTILKILCVIVVVVSNRVYNNPRFSVSKAKAYVPMNKEILIIYQIGLLLGGLGMFFPLMNRIGFYFLMYEMPFWGQAVKAVKNRRWFQWMITAILVYIFASTIVSGSEGLLNYTTFFAEK